MSSLRPGQAASLLFNFSVLLVAATGVAFGLDWMRAPLPPMPETEASVQAAKLAAHLPPPRAVTVVAKTPPRSVYPARPAAPDSNAVAAVNPAAQDRQAPAIAAPEPAAVQTPAGQPNCDIAACSAAYHSFRASDCTWQPFDGPRRICDKGSPPQSEAAAEPDATPDATPASDKCDVAACQRAYFTFNPADCTYKPSNGPRRLCDKGHPPQKTAVAEPAASPPPAAAPAPAAAADSAPVSNKCDVEACKQAYFTFNAADCTYQPSDGARRLCTKGTPPKPEAALPPPPPVAAAPPPNAVPPSAASPSVTPAAPAAPAVPPASNTEPPKQEAAVPPAAAPAAPPSPAATAPADIAAPPAPAPPAAAPAPVSDKCDVEACKRAYFTFDPVDCTYKPSSGPRRLCSKGAPPKPQAAAPAAAPDHPVPPGLVPARR